MIAKKIKAYKANNLLRFFLFFFSFVLLQIYSFVFYAFFQRIYLYSDGYQDNYAYSTNVGLQDYEELPKDQIFYADNIQTELDGSTIHVTAETSDNIYESKGFLISGRVLVTYDEKDFHRKENTLPQQYCLTSRKDAGENISFKDTNYPVAGYFSFHLMESSKIHYELSGINNIDITLFINKEKEPKFFCLGFIICKDPYLVQRKNNFALGKDLNEEYRQGYRLYLPLLYLVFLVPLSVFVVALMTSLRQVCSFEIQETFLKRTIGISRAKNFWVLFGERILPMILAFILSLVFLPILNTIKPGFNVLSLSLMGLNLLLLLVGLWILTKKDIRKVYHAKISFLENQKND